MSDQVITDWKDLTPTELRHLAIYGKSFSIRKRAEAELQRRRAAEQAAQKTEANHAG